ncbi:MAG: N-6 DNA methylase, partial [candidate division WOR-3 bacterium]
LKKLYQYLVPQEVRHRLGEYYTPDWLAELLIKEVGYDGNNSERLLDPACGSGTFLVLAIQKAKEWGLKNKRHALDIAKSIKANIWGFDLNPLAVIAARTNYLFALGDFVDEMLNKGESIEIPVYLTDSVLTPTRITGNLFGEFLEVATSVGKFQIPAEWVRMGGFLLSRAAPLIEEMAENQYSIEEAMERFKKEGLVFPYNQETVKNFYNQILELQKQNKNGIWARFLKNAFAPMIAGKFDYVIGNPPWIRWEYLSREYREATKNQWESYGLSIIRESKDTLGRGKKDFSMLFVYASVDYYLKNGGKLAFLITQEVFKSKSSGEGFRRFQLGNKIYLKVLRAHDLVLIKPFERASNKTAAIILKKGEKTEYPVPYIVWLKRKGVTKISPDTLLNEVFKLTNRKKMLAKPISSETSPWQNYERAGHLLPVKGLNYYRAKIGARTEPYSIFWLKIIDIIGGGNLLIENITEGKRKKQIKKLEARIIENEFVYPSLRGADVSRWGYKAQLYTLILNDPDNPTKPFPEKLMKLKFPLTYSYLLNFKSELLDREAYKKFHLKAGRPFYAQFNISRDTFANYKVVWKRMTDDIFACVLPPIKTLFGYKVAIPLDTTSFIAASSELEAHYLCSILNSKLVREFIRSFSSTGRGFGSPSVINYLGIPRFDTNNLLHRNIADISKKFHQLKIEGNDIEIKKLEKENDELIKKLFRIRN